MGEAYTPGLEISQATTVRKKRILPILGEVITNIGELVSPDTIVARYLMSGPITVVNVADNLRIRPEQLEKCLKKNIGDAVSQDECLALYSTFFGLSKREVRCPTSGTIKFISRVTGQVHVSDPPVSVDVNAYIRGQVVEVLPSEGVVIETPACYIQGIFGVGGERHGEIMVVVDSLNEVLTADKITPEHSGKIIVTRTQVTEEAIQKACKESVKGIITGGIDDNSLINILGYDIGVAITGHENINTTIIVTEGFGRMVMTEKIFNLLKKHNNKEASINGATQIRAGVIRPEIIIPLDPMDINKINVTSETTPRLELGATVRVIRGPDFGALGHVIDMPVRTQEIETESKTVVIKICLEDGREVILPRANVEMI